MGFTSRTHLTSNKMTWRSTLSTLTLCLLVLTFKSTQGQGNPPSTPPTTFPPKQNKGNGNTIGPGSTPGPRFNFPTGGIPTTIPPPKSPNLSPPAPGPVPPPGGYPPGPASDSGQAPSPSVSNSIDTPCPLVINQYCGDSNGQTRFSQDIVNPDGQQKMASQVYGGSTDMKHNIESLEKELAIMKTQVQELMGISMHRIDASDANRDCDDMFYRDMVKVPGIYEANPGGQKEFPVYCNYEIGPDGTITNKWTVIMNRVDGTTSFDRTWAEYRDGFGTLGMEFNFWLGLEKMHLLTSQRQYTLHINLTDWDGKSYYAEYSSFVIGSEAEGYPIFYDGYSGTAGDSLGDYHRGMKFTTIDRDNDLAPTVNCARTHGGGWWYKDCDHANLNGPYSYGHLVLKDKDVDTGLEWDETKLMYSFATAFAQIKPTYGDEQ